MGTTPYADKWSVINEAMANGEDLVVVDEAGTVFVGVPTAYVAGMNDRTIGHLTLQGGLARSPRTYTIEVGTGTRIYRNEQGEEGRRSGEG